MKVICPDCSAVSKEELWNKATMDFWGNDSVHISTMLRNDKKNASEYWFSCPVCHENSVNGDKLITIEDND
jgi:hypothetical protein